MMSRTSTPLLGLAFLALVALLGCREQATTSPDAATAETPKAEATPETPEQSCTRMLARFGEDIAEAESEGCVAALSGGTELDVCKEAGADDEYVECFDSCMASVGIDAASYDPGDSSTSPVVNCVAGCFSTTCE